MKDRSKYILSALIVVTVVTGCSKFKAAKDKDKSKENPQMTTEKKDQYRMAETFQDNKTQMIDLIEGPATFEMKYEGNSAFTVKLLNNDGDLIDILADVTGPYKGTKTISVPKTSSYLLDVKTTGLWSVNRK